MPNVKALVLGAGGLLGGAMLRGAPAGWTATGTARAELDITDADAIESRLTAAAPDWVINCAGYTRVDETERDATAWDVNAVAPGVIGTTAARIGARVLHLSTEYVFDGTLGRPYREDDAVNPINQYGRGKLAGEQALAASGAGWLVARVQWLYGDRGQGFIRTARERARAGQPIRAVTDRYGAPTDVDALAEMLWRLIAAEARGVVHTAASGATTWSAIAHTIYKTVGADESLITDCTTAEYAAAVPGVHARRPLDGRMDTGRYRSLTGHVPEDWLGPLIRFAQQQ